VFFQCGHEARTSVSSPARLVHCTQGNAKYRKMLTMCPECTVVSSDNRKFRVAVFYIQCVTAMTQCTNDGKMTATYIVHTMVSLYYRKVVEATRSNPCDFTIPPSNFTQQYTACAVVSSV